MSGNGAGENEMADNGALACRNRSGERGGGQATHRCAHLREGIGGAAIASVKRGKRQHLLHRAFCCTFYHRDGSASGGVGSRRRVVVAGAIANKIRKEVA